MNPDITRQVATLHGERSPGFPAVRVTFVGCCATEREGKTDYETKNSKEEGVDGHYMRLLSDIILEIVAGRGRRLTRMHEFRNAGYESGPACYHSNGEDHTGEDAAMHSHEIGELGMSFHVTWSDLYPPSARILDRKI